MLPVIRKALLDAACENVDASLVRIEAEYPKDIVSEFGFSWKIYGISGTKSASASEAIASETEQVKGVIREIVVQLRTEFSEKVSSIAKIIARGGKIPSTSLESAREVLKRVKEMNVFGDAELTNQVRAFERILRARLRRRCPTEQGSGTRGGPRQDPGDAQHSPSTTQSATPRRT